MNREVLVFELARRHATLPAGPLQLRYFSAGDVLPEPTPYSPADVELYLSDSWRLAVLFLSDVPVSFGWVRIAPEHNVSEVHAILAAGNRVGWIVHCETPVAHRNNGYYAKLVRGIAAQCAADRYIIYCLRQNRASRRGIENAGFHETGTLRRRLGKLQCTPRLGRVHGNRIVQESREHATDTADC